MDSIQLTLDVPLKKNSQCPKSLTFKYKQLPEAACPLLVPYSTWLRKINAILNKTDVMHQNEQKKSEFKFLCEHNLLFFLTVTGQFKVIEELFSTPSFTIQLHHLIAFIKKEQHKAKQVKMKRLCLLKLTQKKEKAPIHDTSISIEEKSISQENSYVFNQLPTFFSSIHQYKKERETHMAPTIKVIGHGDDEPWPNGHI